MLPFFFCVSGGGVVQIRASTRAPSEGGGHDFCHSNSDSRKLDGGLPGIWGSLTSDLPREDAGGSSSGTSWYRAGLLRALEARPLPASIAPDAVHHPDSNNDWQTTAQWCEMSGWNPRRFFPSRLEDSATAARCWRVPSDHRRVSDRPPHETATFRVELASLRASTAPLALIAGRLIAPDISESGGLGDSQNFHISKTSGLERSPTFWSGLDAVAVTICAYVVYFK